MKNQKNLGLLLGVLSYAFWGSLIYFWHLLSHVNSMEVLSYRILFTIISMALYFVVTRQCPKLSRELMQLWRDKKHSVLLS